MTSSTPPLADTIRADDQARTVTRRAEEAKHAGDRSRAADALHAALAPDADPAPIAALATALGVDTDALADVLRGAR